MNPKFNILHTYYKNDYNVYLVPFIEIYNNEYTISNYPFWFNNGQVNQYNSHGVFPYDPRTDIEEMMQDKTQIIWAIVIEYNEYPFKYYHIGNVSLQSIDLINRSAEFSIIIGDSNQYNSGIASFACNSICDHGFKKLGLHRIYGGAAAGNIGMLRVFEKCGFKKDGEFKDALFLNGEFTDVYHYGLLNDYNRLGNE